MGGRRPPVPRLMPKPRGCHRHARRRGRLRAGTGVDVTAGIHVTAGIEVTGVDLAPADRLAVARGELLDREHSADHQRAGDVDPHGLDRLDLEADPDQRRGDLAGRQLRQLNVLTQPGQRDAHLNLLFHL